MTDSQQQFCLRWNNFQANITSQFEALRDDEDFVDVTFACDGRRLQAHKVVLSACSPYFKELFKTNPCKHPIIFMRDVEFEHLQSLLEFMYAGEVNISQAELPTFLRTAESLQIRGLTDSQSNRHNNEKHSKTNNIHASNGRGLISPSLDDDGSKTPPATSPPPLKRLCKRSESPQNSSPIPNATPSGAASTQRSRPPIEPHVQIDYKDLDIVEPKIELPEYGSDDDCSTKPEINALPGGFLSLDGGMEVLPTYPPSYQGSGMDGGMAGTSHGSELNQEQQAAMVVDGTCIGTSGAGGGTGPGDPWGGPDTTGGTWDSPRLCPLCARVYSNNSNLRRHLRSAHATATDLLELTSLQRRQPTTSLPPPIPPPLSPPITMPDHNKMATAVDRQSKSNFELYGRRVRRGRPRLGTRGGRQLSGHGDSPSRGDWLPLDMRTAPPAVPAFRGFEEATSDGVAIAGMFSYYDPVDDDEQCDFAVALEKGKCHLYFLVYFHLAEIGSAAGAPTWGFKLVHLGEGIAVCEEQLRAVKWSDYRKLTRGLAAILFSPTELATCSVTGQRWSRAGTATERPVKPALDRAKVQAIISYVTSRFPTVDVSSVKQVLAYKCKENSTALKMKSIRYICERQDTETSPRGESEDK